MYQVSFFQYPPKEIVAIDFILQDSVYIFTDGKSTVAAFPASVVSGIIHSVKPSSPEPVWDDEDYEDDDEDYESPTEEELMLRRLMNNAVETMYSDEAIKNLKAQTPLDKIFKYKPLPAASGKEIQFFTHSVPNTVAHHTTGGQVTTSGYIQNVGINSNPNVCGDLGAASAITSSPASGEQLLIDTSNFLLGEWRGGYYNQAPTDVAMVQPAPEPVTTDSLWSKYYKAEREARETLVALQDELFAKQRQDNTEKEALGEDYEVGPRPPAVHPKDSDLCSFENVVAGATFLRGLEY